MSPVKTRKDPETKPQFPVKYPQLPVGLNSRTKTLIRCIVQVLEKSRAGVVTGDLHGGVVFL